MPESKSGQRTVRRDLGNSGTFSCLGTGNLVEESLTSATAWSSASKKKDAAVPRSHSPSCRRVVIP